jgi:hypothetical protein
MTPNTPGHFDLGLVMAGAISAGAYSAGVVDFLLLALRAWEKERGKDGEAEEHAVRLRVMAGASAGGMTGGMLLGALAREAAPVTEDPGPRSANPLFDAWVNRIDALHLLRSDDLKLKEGLPVSLLDSSVLEDIVSDVLDFPKPMPPRPAWLAERFDLLYTVTNLHGVPYSIKFTEGHSHGLLQHSDYLQFGVRDDGPLTVKLTDIKLDPALNEEAAYTSNWNQLHSARWLPLLSLTSLATGAFPIALAHRTLEHRLPRDQPNVYSLRRWDRYRFWRDVTKSDRAGVPPVPEESTRFYHRDRIQLKQSWTDDITPRVYTFACSDGGVMNNEPFELVRQILARDRERWNEAHKQSQPNPESVPPLSPSSWLDSSGHDTRQAMLLIDPFPGGETRKTEYAPPEHLLATAMQLFGALKNQARFKPQELMDAMSDSVFSRYVIAPTREVGGEGGHAKAIVAGDRAIACGSLGGFGGFIDRSLRAHDFFLGRQNCQSFLRQYFVLPADATIFSDTYRNRFPASEWNKKVKVPDGNGGMKEIAVLPVLPLVGDAAVPVMPPKYPNVSRERVNAVMEAVERRYEAVTERTLSVFLKGNLMALFTARYARNLSKRNAMKWVRTRLEGGLKTHGLYR